MVITRKGGRAMRMEERGEDGPHGRLRAPKRTQSGEGEAPVLLNLGKQGLSDVQEGFRQSEGEERGRKRSAGR